MITTSIEQLAKPIGFDIAMSSDIAQSDLLNGLGEGFKIMGKDRTQTQLCYVSQKTTKEAEDFILSLAEIIKLKRE